MELFRADKCVWYGEKEKSIGITIQPADIAGFKTSGLVGSFALIVATI